MLDFNELPKVELHKHLEGSIRLKTLCELSGKSEQEVRKEYLVTEPMNNLAEVLNCFMATQRLLNSYEAIERITYEVVEDAFLENTKLLELRYAPSFIAEGHSHLEFSKIQDAIMNGIKAAQEKYDILVGLIGIIVRSHSMATAEESLELFLDRKNEFVAIDLADNEDDFSPRLFEKIFSKAKAEGMKVTIHAGEVNTDQAPKNIMDAINILGADRIGHGLQCVKDEKVMSYIKEKNIHLELCPISNWITNAIPGKSDHPFKQIQDYGISCSISSDDPGIFNSSLTQDLELARDLLGLEEEHFRKAMSAAFDASFLPNKHRFTGLFR